MIGAELIEFIALGASVHGLEPVIMRRRGSTCVCSHPRSTVFLLHLVHQTLNPNAGSIWGPVLEVA